MKIRIDGKDYEFRYGWGALYLYEAATGGQNFDAKNHAALHLMLFCVLANANGAAWSMKMDDFVRILDTEKGLAVRLSKAFAAEMERWSAIQAEDEDTGEASGEGAEKKSH